MQLEELERLHKKLQHERNRLVALAEQEQDQLESLGRDGRRLRKLAADIFMGRYAEASKRLSAVERSIELANFLLVKDSVKVEHRASVADHFEQAIRQHQQAIGSDARPEDRRLWETIEGISL